MSTSCRNSTTSGVRDSERAPGRANRPRRAGLNGHEHELRVAAGECGRGEVTESYLGELETTTVGYDGRAC